MQYTNVLEVPIKDVVEAFCNVDLVSLKECVVSNMYKGKSPFRNESDNSSFYIKNNDNFFKDMVIPNCEGNSIDFVSKLLNISKKDAEAKIKEKFL